MPTDNLITKRIGLLTVIRLTDKRYNGSLVYECLCDCGNTAFVTSSNIRANHTKSCGCLKHQASSNRLNLDGMQFGLLTVLKVSHRTHKTLYWECLCQCGITTLVRTGSLRSGATRSCGCQEGAPTHRLSHTPLYQCWHAMQSRCFDTNDRGYKHYGARGITVCKGWQSIENFAVDMGAPPKGLSIDRINNNSGYWCGHCDECVSLGRWLNCRWETSTTQNRNKSNNHAITANGKTMLLVEWVQETGMSKNTIINRLKRGWSEEDAINKPVDSSKRRKAV